MKTKLVVNTKVVAKRFDEKSFFSFALGFTPPWDFQKYNEHPSENIINLSTIDKIRWKNDCNDGSVVIELRQPILFSFVLDEPCGYEVFREPETIHYKEIASF